MQEKTLRKLAKPMCAAAAFIWGSSFFIMKNTLDTMPVFYLLAIRFTVGAVLLAIVFNKKVRSITKDYLWRGAIVGFMLFMAYTAQTFGLAGTTPSKNAFLTAVYCVIVPFLYWAFEHKRPDRYNIGAALLCIAGIGLVELDGSISINSGDVLTLCSAFFYAAHIISVAKTSEGKDIYLITIMQFLFAGLYSWICALLFDVPPTTITQGVFVSMLYLSIMATTIALLFQNVGQANSDPMSASVLLSLESVFGVACSVIFYGDPVTFRLIAGFVVIFVAIICSETKFTFLRKKTVLERQTQE
ncbi:MAG: DMT family transporter [Oscillospiraceae bacterium]|nr:DMT family transporter [Oscillospiraceae bacterium]